MSVGLGWVEISVEKVSGAGLRTDESFEAFETFPDGGWAYDVDV